MKAFFAGLLAAFINAAAKGAASAGDSGASLQTVGIAAGATGIAGILAYVLQHPVTASPAATASVQAFTAAPAPVPVA